MDEQAMLQALEGKFVWEPTTNPYRHDQDRSKAIREAQKKHAGNVRHIFNVPEAMPLESIKPVKPRVLRGEAAILLPYIKAISEVYDISSENLLGKSTKIGKPKHHLVWAIMTYMPKMTFAEVGRLLEKNHTTIMHNYKMFKENFDANKVAEVERKLGIK